MSFFSVRIGEDSKTRRKREDHTGSFLGISFPRETIWPANLQSLVAGGPAKSSFCFKERYDGKVFATHRNWNGLLATWHGCTFASWRRCVRVADSKRVLQPYNVNVLREKGVMLDKIFWVTYATEFCFASVPLYTRFWYCYRGARGVDLQVAFFVHQFFNSHNGEIARDSQR